MATGIRDLKKEKYWLELVEKHKESGKSQAQFCREQSLNAHQFHYWKTVLAKRRKTKDQAKPLESKVALPFVHLKVPDSIDLSSKHDSAEQIEISKIVLRISANTDNSTLACILESMVKPRC
jgi:hypothetical protein